jgi:type II secretory pathway component GspD/PulD (secretin)
LIIFAAFLGLQLLGLSALAQETRPGNSLITLNFPENLDLKVLVDYVAERLSINIAYDEQINDKRVTLRTPAPIPKSSLLDLLEGALKMKGMALVDGDQPGWKRIVPATDLLQVAPRSIPAPRGEGEPAPLDAASAAVVTQVFALKRTEPGRIEQAVKSLLTQPGSSTLSLPEQGLIVVTDYASNMTRVADLIALLDRARDNIIVEFLPVEHLEAAELAPQITQLLASKQKAAGTAANVEGLDVSFTPRTNQLVLVGTRERIEEARTLAASLDTPLAVDTRVYQFHTASVDRVDRLVKELIGPLQAKRAYRSAADREAGLLVVTATQAVHARIVELRAGLDRPVPQGQSRVRSYRLENATAADVLDTIQALEGGEGFEDVTIAAADQVEPASPRGDLEARPPAEPQGPNQPPPAPGAAPPLPPVQAVDSQTGSLLPRDANGAAKGVRTKNASVTADENTNSIIVMAEPEIQEIYAQLIRMLDRRRPQVLVELTLVAVDTTRNFNLGVEIIGRGTAGPTRFLNFTSFGLSEIDPESGQVMLTPGVGFNGAVLTADVADIVIQALKANTRARVSSSPKLLVNDNATGTLASVAESPFTSLNASDTVATTSFAGFVSAGTTVSLTPHISEGDHLQLEYTVTLNNFTGQATTSGGAVLPPPRQTNSVNSKVTVPDGHTIVVGGLNRKNMSRTKTGVPILGDIPLVEYFFSNRTETESEQTLFVFIKPVILRDDQFKDLKYLSERETRKAELGRPFPSSVPLTVR